MSSEYLIPHPNVPTSDIGLPKLKECTMLFNENFLALDAQARTNATGISGLSDTKAEKDHEHDATYAKLGHTHSMQEVESLDENLSLKAPLVHEHPQYLTTMPAHTHNEEEVNGLVADLAGKASAEHSHLISDVTGLDSELSTKATQAQLSAVAGMIPVISGLTTGRFVAAASANTLETPANQPVLTNGTINANHLVKFTKDANNNVLVEDAGIFAPGTGESGLDTVAITGKRNSVTKGNLLEAGDAVDVVDSGIKGDDAAAVVGAFSFSETTATLPVKNVNFGDVTNVTSGNLATQGSDIFASKATETTASDAATAAGNAQTAAQNAVTTANAAAQAVAGKANADHAHGNITSDGKISDASGKFIVGGTNGLLSVSNLGAPTDVTDVGMISSIASLFDYANNNFKLSTSHLHYPTGEGLHNNSCFLTVDSSGNVVHGGNEQYDKLTLIQGAFDFTQNQTAFSNARLPIGRLHVNSAASHGPLVLGVPASTTQSDQDVQVIDGLPSTAVSLGKSGEVEKHLSDYVGADGVSVSSINGVGDGILKGSGGKITSGSLVAGDIPDLSGTYAKTGAVSSLDKRISDIEDDYLTKENIGVKDGVQAYNANLTALAGTLQSKTEEGVVTKAGLVPLSQLTGNIDKHNGNCLVTIDGDGALGHSGNDAFNMLINATYSDGEAAGTKRANLDKLITNIDIGNGLEYDSIGESATFNIQVKCKENGGLSATSSGLEVIGAATYDTDYPPANPSIVSMDSDGVLTDECELPTESTTNKVLTCKAGGTALSWEDIVLPSGESGSFISGANISTDSREDPRLNYKGPTSQTLDTSRLTNCQKTWNQGDVDENENKIGVKLTVCTGIMRLPNSASGSYYAHFSNLYFDNNGLLTKVETAKNYYQT